MFTDLFYNRFQNCVILDSDKTHKKINTRQVTFQNCVILDSDKTKYKRM